MRGGDLSSMVAHKCIPLRNTVQHRQGAAAVERKAAAVERKAAAVERKAAAVERKAAAVERKAAAVERKAAAVEWKAAAVVWREAACSSAESGRGKVESDTAASPDVLRPLAYRSTAAAVRSTTAVYRSTAAALRSIVAAFRSIAAAFRTTAAAFRSTAAAPCRCRTVFRSGVHLWATIVILSSLTQSFGVAGAYECREAVRRSVQLPYIVPSSIEFSASKTRLIR